MPEWRCDNGCLSYLLSTFLILRAFVGWTKRWWQTGLDGTEWEINSKFETVTVSFYFVYSVQSSTYLSTETVVCFEQWFTTVQYQRRIGTVQRSGKKQETIETHPEWFNGYELWLHNHSPRFHVLIGSQCACITQWSSCITFTGDLNVETVIPCLHTTRMSLLTSNLNFPWLLFTLDSRTALQIVVFSRLMPM